MSGVLREVSKNTLYQIFAKAATVCVSLIITAIITRQLSVDSYGDFIKIMSFVSVFYLLADFGFNATFLKKTKDQSLKADFDKFFALRILTSSFLTVVCILIVLPLPYFSANQTGYSTLVKAGVFLGAFTILFQGLFNSTNAIFQKKLRYDLSSIATIISSLATLVLVIMIIPSKNLLLLVLTYTFSNAVLFLVAYRLLSKLSFHPKADFDTVYIKNTFKMSLSIGVALIINLIYFRIDTIILGFYRSPAEVGFYGLAYRIFETVLVIPIFFSNSIFPVFLAHLDNIAVLRRIFYKSALLLITLSVVISIVFYFASDLIITIISGPDFSSAADLLKILSLGYPFFYLSAIVMWLLISFNKQRFLSILYLVIGSLNFMLNMIFIPTHGAYASAIITVISEFAILIGGSIILFKYLRKND